MRLEQVSITVYRDPTPESDTSGNLSQIEKFGRSSTGALELVQPLRSILIEDRSGYHRHFGSSTIEGIRSVPAGVQVAYTRYDSRWEGFVTRDAILSREDIDEHTYEHHGFEHPDLSDPEVARFPKYDLVRQAAEKGRLGQVQVEESHTWGPLGILIKGEGRFSRITLESLGLDEMPLTDLEREVIRVAGDMEEWRERVLDLQTLLYVASGKSIHKIGRDNVRSYGPRALYPYLTNRGRFNLRMKELHDRGDRNSIGLPKRDAYRAGIRSTRWGLDKLFPNIGLSNASLALKKEVLRRKAEYSSVDYLNTQPFRDMIARAEAFLRVTIEAIQQEGVLDILAVEAPEYLASIRESDKWLSEYGLFPPQALDE